jgi:hypothetical protein
MAIGLRTHHTFTLTNLLRAVSTRHCAICGKDTPSLDMRDLRRICMRSTRGKFSSYGECCKFNISHFNEFLLRGWAKILVLQCKTGNPIDYWDSKSMARDVEVAIDGQMRGENGVRVLVDERVSCVEVALE